MENRKKVIICGGTGFIGSHTSVELLSQGYQVVIADNLSNSERDILDRIETLSGHVPIFEEVDLTDEQACDRFFERHSNTSAVIHFAAFKAVGESVNKPLMYYKNNLQSTVNILRNMDRLSIPNFIFSSSATVYGDCEELPITEKSPILPASSPYGKTKQINESIIEDTFKAENNLAAAISLRYFNPIGGHLSGELGEVPIGPPNNLMPYITQTAIGVREQLSVFGNDYPTPDGTCIRDYIHVVDLAKAHLVALERLINKKNKSFYEIFNLGTGNGFSVMDVIKSFEKMAGQKLNYTFAPRRAGDQAATYADVTKAKNELGWVAELSIDEMTSSAWKWEQNYRRNLS